MASCCLNSQFEDQRPQSSSLGLPMVMFVSEESPGPSALWASSGSLPWRPGYKRKWSAAFGAEVEDKAQDSWIVKSLSGLRMKLKKQPVFLVLPEHHMVFNKMIEDHVIKRFLAWDRNLKVSDKYLLAMVIAYFSRAGLFSWQYRRIHFFIALYLASKMEEDNQAPKQIIFSKSVRRSKLFTRGSGCGIEIVPSCPRGPTGPQGPEITSLRKDHPEEMRIFKGKSIQTLMTATRKDKGSLCAENGKESSIF
ncbi:hypothetical protein CapIbe_021018 [Capra ibex]